MPIEEKGVHGVLLENDGDIPWIYTGSGASPATGMRTRTEIYTWQYRRIISVHWKSRKSGYLVTQVSVLASCKTPAETMAPPSKR